MMDLKEIIKWFIPCFHILLVILKSKDVRLTFVCLFLLFNFRVGCAANVRSGLGVVSNDAKNVNSLVYGSKLILNQSDEFGEKTELNPVFPDGSVGRTFGRPFKKMMGAMLPLIFQIGAASTWAVVAALVGVKTLIVSVVILKILLIAGAAKAIAYYMAGLSDRLTKEAVRPPPLYKLYNYDVLGLNHGRNNTIADASKLVPEVQIGALFGSKGHGHDHHGWEPAPHHPQKEIHLHIHNGHQETHDEHAPVYGPWSRDDTAIVVDPKNNLIDPYTRVGPQTIRTPFGNYVKVEPNGPSSQAAKRR